MLNEDYIEDLKEVAPCGLLIHYTVDRTSNFVVYNDICDRGHYRLSPNCSNCSWRGICKPTEADFLKILSDTLGRTVTPLEVIIQFFERRDQT